jgi:hypothetical protein
MGGRGGRRGRGRAASRSTGQPSGKTPSPDPRTVHSLHRETWENSHGGHLHDEEDLQATSRELDDLLELVNSGVGGNLMLKDWLISRMC